MPLNRISKSECPNHIKKELSTVVRNMESLDSYLSDLMGLSHVFIRPHEMNIEEYELGSFMRNRILSLHNYVPNLKIIMDFDYASVWFDASKISQVINKFIIHAMRYVTEEEDFSIQVSYDSDYWAIKINDSTGGRLIKHYKYKRHRMLNRFVLLGIISEGMLADKLLGVCNGEIMIDKEENNVSLRFPVNHSCRSISSPKSENVLEEPVENVIDTFLVSSPKKSAGRHVIIIADSDDKFRHYLERCLSEEYMIKSFNNGIDAWESIKEEYPDLVICDLLLSGMDGDELSSRLKTSMDISFVPVILLGSPLDMDIRQKRQYSLADAFMLKSCNPEDLKVEISVQIDNSRFLRRSFLQKVFGENFLTESTVREGNIEFINKVKEYILDNLEKENLKIDEIAVEMNICRTAFYNKWKSLTGEAPESFIHKIRMEKARELLESGNYNVNQIPEKIGLKDVKNFRKKYKAYFGRNPIASKKAV